MQMFDNTFRLLEIDAFYLHIANKLPFHAYFIRTTTLKWMHSHSYISHFNLIYLDLCSCNRAPQKHALPWDGSIPYRLWELGFSVNLKHSFLLKVFRKLISLCFLKSLWFSLRIDLLVFLDNPIFVRCKIHCWSFKGSSSTPKIIVEFHYRREGF